MPILKVSSPLACALREIVRLLAAAAENMADEAFRKSRRDRRAPPGESLC
jgi:hypothetical protein